MEGRYRGGRAGRKSSAAQKIRESMITLPIILSFRSINIRSTVGGRGRRQIPCNYTHEPDRIRIPRVSSTSLAKDDDNLLLKTII